MLHMTVKGKYVYEIRWINGDIEFEDQGTVDKPKPKIEAVDIINKTSDTITVKVSTLRNEGGTLKCYIKKENADYVFVKEQIEGNNTFEIDIESDTTYSNIKVEAIAKNGETASKEVEIVNIPTLTEKTVTLSYEVNGEIIDETDWTQGPVVVTVSTETEGYTLQTSQDGNTWKDAEIAEQNPSTSTKISSRATTRTVTTTKVQKSTQTFTTNGTIYARLIDKTTGQKGKEYTKKITNIDKLAPDTFTPTATSTTNSITLTGSTEDATATNENASSGIKEYWFAYSDDNGATWKEWVTNTPRTQTSYTFNNLTQNKTYSLKMKAVDNAGNETKEPIIITKTTVPSGEDNIKFSYSNENADGEVIWTNTRDNNVDVTITVAETVDMSQFKLEYKKDNETTWNNINSGGKVPFTANGVLYARLVDRTIEGEAENGETTYATANVTKIDNVEPTVSKQLAVVADSTTTNSIKVSITIQDKKSENAPETETVSGLDKVIWYYKKSTETKYQSQESSIGETNKTGVTQGLTTPLSPFIEFTDLTSNTTYNIYAEVYDVAGNMTRSPASGTVNAKTKDVPGGATNIGMGGLTGSSAIGIDYELANWTNKDVNVTLTNKTGNSDYRLFYKKDNASAWTLYSGPITFTENGTIVAVLTDSTEGNEIGNIGATATGNVTKIDKVKPTVSKQLAVVADSTTTNSIEVSITTQDKKSSTTSTTETVSGLDKIIWYYKKSTDSNTSYNQNKKETTFRASGATGATQGSTISVSPSIFIDDLTSNTTYNIYAEVYDVAGNMTRSPASGTVNVATYTISYQGIGGTNVPADQMKIQGKDLTLSSTKPTRSGYWFKDWCIYNPSTSNYQNGVRMLRARGNIL